MPKWLMKFIKLNVLHWPLDEAFWSWNVSPNAYPRKPFLFQASVCCISPQLQRCVPFKLANIAEQMILNFHLLSNSVLSLDLVLEILLFTLNPTSFIQFLSAAFSNMGVFYQEEQPHQSKRCKFLATVLKEAFSNCHTFNGQRSDSCPEEEYSTSAIVDESEVVVSEIRSRAMEKMKSKPSRTSKSLSWVLSPSTGELRITSNQAKRRDEEDKGEEKDEFFSIGSCFSFYSSAVSKEAFLSANTDFSRCSSLNKIEFPEIWKFDFHDFRRRSIIHELCHCEGWPFGLCKKTVLLPPLPKSPSESWSWRKGTGLRLSKSPLV
ncbi:hypothetical protein V6N13_065671 [Hibiscus sabdariffa]|uniref:Uncharacterized protein n=1 Tax=Hibiscus sabdariffa TaxID=183260 RepID=A0ABR2QQ66_9ROSI